MADDECEGIASQMHSVMEQMDQLTKAYSSKIGLSEDGAKEKAVGKDMAELIPTDDFFKEGDMVRQIFVLNK